jgi:polyphenol oxidase
MITYNSSLKIFSSSKINSSEVISGFGTKDLGDAKKPEPIIMFLKTNNISYKSLVVMQQIHSINIHIYNKIQDSGDYQVIEDVDGLVTKEKDVVLVARTGDCVPIIYSDEKNNIIGISHQGWRGSVKKMVQKMIQTMLDLGAQIQYLKIAIGPSIGACCYEISDDLYYEFLDELNGYSEKIFTHRHGKWHLNLLLLNYLLCLDMGIDKNHIDFFPFCTRCDKKRFFSYRRDKKQDFGEMMSFIIRN